jgi:hypothetical protein
MLTEAQKRANKKYNKKWIKTDKGRTIWLKSYIKWLNKKLAIAEKELENLVKKV